MERFVRGFEAFAEHASGSGADFHVTVKFENAEMDVEGRVLLQTIVCGGDLNALVSITDDGAIVEKEGDAEAEARSAGNTATADHLAAVRAAGGWRPYVAAQRKPYIDALLTLRERLPALRDRGRAASASSVRAHERLFLETPADVFGHVLTFWQSDRDP
ncbi:spectrin binding protein [Aureococcus anophagefferens]|uniref:Spectrin binding protein n=1 Tax=Aureococcus anophagefferens TaxID=44056 RepID=A0ABR1G1E7_AURAN|nr:hypothetical protein JL720_1861 [Aureococcus anophagefferens]